MTDRLLPNQAIRQGERITSQNGIYYFILQTDGNVVVYDNKNAVLWSPNVRGGAQAVMQTDGNFVVYDAQNRPVFSTETAGHPGAQIVVQNDGNFVVYKDNRPLWDRHKAAETGGIFGKIAGTLGGAASSLAHGVADAAKITGKAFTVVTGSPVWKIAAVGLGVAIPGIGTAISAGMLVASKIGQAAASKDGIINAAKGLLPDDPAIKAGFDIGTGVAIHGEGMTEAALKAVREQVPDGQAKIGFDAALSIHVGRVTAKKPAPPHLTPPAKAAFYATKGLIAVKATATMKKAVVASVATTPAAKKGVHAAVLSAKIEAAPKDVTWLEWFWHETKHATSKVFAPSTDCHCKE